MQDAAHLTVDGKVYLVLRRATRHGVALKLRTTGKHGTELTDEGIFFETDKDALARLLRGEVVKV
jgi:hypothetical protein